MSLHIKDAAKRPELRFTSSVNHTADPRLVYRPEAHQARLQGDVNLRRVQPEITDVTCGLTHCHQFGVSRDGGIHPGAVVAPSDHLSAMHDDGTDRDLAGIQSEPGLLKRLLHELQLPGLLRF